MKKFFLITGLVLATMAVNAQWYMGGSLGIETNTSYNSKGEKIGIATTNFSIIPEAGYQISSKADLGISFHFLNTIRNSYQGTPGDLISKSKSIGLGISPYVRYSFFKFGDFDVLGKFALNVLSSTDKRYDRDGNETVRFSSTMVGVNATPLLFYNLSDRIALYTQLNFLGLDFSSTTDKTGSEKTGSITAFTFGADSGNLVNLGQIQIGFIYRF